MLFPSRAAAIEVDRVDKTDTGPPGLWGLSLLALLLGVVHTYVMARKTLPQLKPVPASEGITESPYWQIVERLVSSNEAKNMENILKFFAWTSILVFVSVLVGVLTLSAGEMFDSELVRARAERLGITMSMLIILFQGWYFARAIQGVMAIYRDKHRFQKALFHSISSKLDPWQRLALLKLAVLRFGTTLIPIVALLSLIFLFASILPGLL